MIEIQNIKKKFGKLKVLNAVDLTFKKGQCIALIGPNACGKTTLIKSILGMVVPDSGKILFNGVSIQNDDQYRAHIGYMPQIGRYPDNMTVGQIIETIKSIRKYKGKFDERLLDEFKLNEMYDKRMRTLSGGTTQKVSACLAFLFNPDVLILDEPTAGLDPLASEVLKAKIIQEKEKGKLILITSHLLSELDDLVTQIVFMQEGKAHFHLAVSDLLQQTGEIKISSAIAHVLRAKENKSSSFKEKLNVEQ